MKKKRIYIYFKLGNFPDSIFLCYSKIANGLQPDTPTTPLPMRFTSMGYTSIGFPSMGYTSTKLLNFSVLIVLL